MGLYHNSYLCIRGFLAPDETSGLLDRAKELLDGFDINDHPMVRGLCYTCVRLSLYAPCSLFFVFAWLPVGWCGYYGGTVAAHGHTCANNLIMIPLDRGPGV